jgi:hypothetical protein
MAVDWEAREKQCEATGDKELASILFTRALRIGNVLKPGRCQQCKKTVRADCLHGHHSDYHRPYDVVWLCTGCHGKRHLVEAYARNSNPEKIRRQIESIRLTRETGVTTNVRRLMAKRSTV